MNCNNCTTSNEPESKFCHHCGFDLNSETTSKHRAIDKYQKLLIIIGSFLVVNSLICVTLSFLKMYYQFNSISLIINIIHSSIPLFIAVTIENKMAKYLLLTFGVINLVASVYNDLSFLH